MTPSDSPESPARPSLVDDCMLVGTARLGKKRPIFLTGRKILALFWPLGFPHLACELVHGWLQASGWLEIHR